MTTKISGNVLGAERAESDAEMLDRAFVETSDFHALISTTDFNYIVGRRGTGKTALSLRIAQHLQEDAHVFADLIRPEEHDVLRLQKSLDQLGLDYRLCRAATRIAWKSLLLISFASQMRRHWKVKGMALESELDRVYQSQPGLQAPSLIASCSAIFRQAAASGVSPRELPASLAENLHLSSLQECAKTASDEYGLTYMVLFDSLDEGWEDTDVGTGLLGGLAIAAADLRDAKTNLQAALFFRDNIFRSLAAKDSDFSRHIEGSTLRLHWDEHSLLELVSARLRVRLQLETVENREKIWNRFVADGMRGRDGFAQCLHYTLYRPRDILVLLNQASVLAARAGDDVLTGSVVATAAEQISKDRLMDLEKEYGQVFPGLGKAIECFRGGPKFLEFREAVELLDGAMEEEEFGHEAASDLAVLGSGRAIVEALYSVGFLGIVERGARQLRFCHDGSSEGVADVSATGKLAIHPCYWRGLNLKGDELEAQVVLEVFDDQDSVYVEPVRDVRLRHLGEVVSALPKVPTGENGAIAFEKWALRAVRILFGNNLTNAELHPNQSATQRRDVIATNGATSGFWRRLLEDYDARQIVFEVKNYQELKLEDYRQVLSYLGKEYGRLGFLIYRGPNEGLTVKERKWVREFYQQHDVLLVSLPCALVVRFLSKLRNPKKRSYAEEKLGKRLDTYLRSYVAG